MPLPFNRLRGITATRVENPELKPQQPAQMTAPPPTMAPKGPASLNTAPAVKGGRGGIAPGTVRPAGAFKPAPVGQDVEDMNALPEGSIRGPAQGGTGFVNLGHLLSINKKGGLQNAKKLAQSRGQAAQAAQDTLGNYSKGFEQQAAANEVLFDKSQADAAAGAGNGPLYNDPNYVEGQLYKASQGYGGPSGLGDMQGFSDFEKGFGKTAGAVSNLGSLEGTAAEIAKDTGLSGAQSAMSSFYSGADNENLRGTASKFKGLGEMLDKEKNKARDRGRMAKERTSYAKEAFGKQLDNIKANKQGWDVADKKAKDAARLKELEAEYNRPLTPEEEEAEKQAIQEEAKKKDRKRRGEDGDF